MGLRYGFPLEKQNAMVRYWKLEMRKMVAPSMDRVLSASGLGSA
jgi:hypothetical protein